MKCPLPFLCCTLTIRTTITHLGNIDKGRKGSQWRPRLQVGPFRGCWSAPPLSRMPPDKKRKKSNYSPSLTNPAGQRHKQGPVKTKSCSQENRSLHLWLRPRCEVKTRPTTRTSAFRGGLTQFQRGCRKGGKKSTPRSAP